MEPEPLPNNSKSEKINKNIMYEQNCGIWKTVVDFRFKIFASFLTLTSLLAVGFINTTGKNDKLVLSIIFAILGIVLTLTMWIMEFRNRVLYREALHFGTDLELDEQFSNGIMTRLVNSHKISTMKHFKDELWKNVRPKNIFKTALTQSKMFDIIFVVTFIFWLLLFFYTLFAYQISTTRQDEKEKIGIQKNCANTATEEIHKKSRDLAHYCGEATTCK